MTTKSATYCKLSHVSMAVQNKGDCCVCNKNNASFGNTVNGEAMYLYDTGLQDMWDSPSRNEIITKLDAGERIPSCHACWNDEAAGVVSTRQKFNAELATLDMPEDQPHVLILKPSNVCNLGCRTCQPATSTGLYQDFYKLEQVQGTFEGSFKEYTSQFETIRDGFGRDNLPVWDTFERWLPGLVFLDIYGGEPLLAPAMWDRMIKVADEGGAKNTDVQIHTNCTIWNQDYIDCLPKFKSARIGISIDAVDPAQLSYVRYGVKADKLFENLDKYIAFAKEHKNVSIYICITVSIFNIWYLDTIVEGLSNHSIGFGINVVYTPEQYDFRHLPQPVKNALIERFENSAPQTKLKLDNVISLLKNNIAGCNIYFPKFWYELKALDKIRSQKFEEVMPEYFAAITEAEPWLLDVQ
jgi:MoaA/NifB/PqqE/SkfB family radical SAM enzyme